MYQEFTRALLTPLGRVFKIGGMFCMVSQPIMHGLKAQKRLGQAKRHPGLQIAIALTPCKGKSIQC